MFFPPASFERKEDKRLREARAKDICQTCPVKRPCLDYALSIREPHGIWGGKNESEPARTARGLTARGAHRGRTDPHLVTSTTSNVR